MNSEETNVFLLCLNTYLRRAAAVQLVFHSEEATCLQIAMKKQPSHACLLSHLIESFKGLLCTVGAVTPVGTTGKTR